MIKQEKKINTLTTKQLDQWAPKITMEICLQEQQEKEGKIFAQNMDISFKQKYMTSETESTKQDTDEEPEFNQANMEDYVTEIARANYKVIEKRLLQSIKRLKSNGKTGSCRSDPEKRKGEKSTASSKSNGKDN